MIAWLPLLLACRERTETPTIPLPEAAHHATFATLASLGSFRLETSVRRTLSGGATAPRTTEQTVDLRWKDADHWSMEQARDGRVLSSVCVWDAVAWSGDGGSALTRRGDAEPYRVQVAQTWDPWAFGLESIADHVAFQQVGVELLDGRRAWRHTVGLAPTPARPSHGWTPSAVSGDVWIDEATALRLKGDVRATAASGPQIEEVELVFAVEGLGLDPGVSPPPRDKP